VVDGSQPPVCHIHKAVAAGDPHNGGAVNARKARTPEEVIELLMSSKDESIRLRAADAYLKRQEAQRDCVACKSRAEREASNASAIQRLTYEQRCQVRELTQTVRDILDSARAQPLMWDPEYQYFRDAEPLPDIYKPTTPPSVEPVETIEDDEPEVEDDGEDPLTQA